MWVDISYIPEEINKQTSSGQNTEKKPDHLLSRQRTTVSSG